MNVGVALLICFAMRCPAFKRQSRMLEMDANAIRAPSMVCGVRDCQFEVKEVKDARRKGCGIGFPQSGIMWYGDWTSCMQYLEAVTLEVAPAAVTAKW